MTHQPKLRRIVGRFIMDKYYLLPQSLRQAVLVQQCSPLWATTGIVFIHIPRSAGSSFDLALYGRFMGHVRAVSIRQWANSQIKSLPSFAITRNPWERLVSSFRVARRGSGTGGEFHAKVFRPERYQICAFETFESFVVEWLSNRDLRKLDPIFQPQSRFLCDRGGSVLVDHVGRIENLGPTLEFIREHLGFVLQIPHANRSGDQIDYRKLYTSKTIEITQQLYAEDIERFGYDFE